MLFRSRTPNIDQLAQRGVRFDRAYCNQAVCSPSRNALLVGLRPQTLGIYDLPTHFRDRAPNALTLPQHLKSQGYFTRSFGKVFHAASGNRDDSLSWSAPSFRPSGRAYQLEENIEIARGNTDSRAAAFEGADAQIGRAHV